MTTCCGCIKDTGNMTNGIDLKTQIDREMIRRLKQDDAPVSPLIITDFIKKMLSGMHISHESQKTISIIVLIYIEKIINKT